MFSKSLLKIIQSQEPTTKPSDRKFSCNTPTEIDLTRLNWHTREAEVSLDNLAYPIGNGYLFESNSNKSKCWLTTPEDKPILFQHSINTDNLRQTTAWLDAKTLAFLDDGKTQLQFLDVAENKLLERTIKFTQAQRCLTVFDDRIFVCSDNRLQVIGADSHENKQDIDFHSKVAEIHKTNIRHVLTLGAKGKLLLLADSGFFQQPGSVSLWQANQGKLNLIRTFNHDLAIADIFELSDRKHFIVRSQDWKFYIYNHFLHSALLTIDDTWHCKYVRIKKGVSLLPISQNHLVFADDKVNSAAFNGESTPEPTLANFNLKGLSSELHNGLNEFARGYSADLLTIISEYAGFFSPMTTNAWVPPPLVLEAKKDSQRPAPLSTIQLFQAVGSPMPTPPPQKDSQQSAPLSSQQMFRATGCPMPIPPPLRFPKK